MRELEDLFVMAEAARTAFNEALKATAERTGFSQPAIRKAVRATVHDKIDEAARDIQQVAELLNIELL